MDVTKYISLIVLKIIFKDDYFKRLQQAVFKNIIGSEKMGWQNIYTFDLEGRDLQLEVNKFREAAGGFKRGPSFTRDVSFGAKQHHEKAIKMFNLKMRR